MTILTSDRARREWIEFLVAQEYTHAVTLKPNHRAERATAEFLRAAFIRFHRDVDQTLFGPRFHLPSKRSLRSRAVGIVEGLPLTGHIHAAFCIAPENWGRFEGLFQTVPGGPTINPKRANPWTARIVGGTSDVAQITDGHGWLSYCTKNFTGIDDADRIIFLPLEA